MTDLRTFTGSRTSTLFGAPGLPAALTPWVLLGLLLVSGQRFLVGEPGAAGLGGLVACAGLAAVATGWPRVSAWLAVATASVPGYALLLTPNEVEARAPWLVLPLLVGHLLLSPRVAARFAVGHAVVALTLGLGAAAPRLGAGAAGTLLLAAVLCASAAGQQLRAELAWRDRDRAHRESESRYRAVVDSGGLAVLLADLGGVVTFANPQANRLLTTRGVPVVGRPLADVLPALAAGGGAGRLTQLRPGSPPHEAEVETFAGSGRWLRWSVLALDVAEADPAARPRLELQLVAWEVTGRRLAEEALRGGRDRLAFLLDELQLIAGLGEREAGTTGLVELRRRVEMAMCADVVEILLLDGAPGRLLRPHPGSDGHQDDGTLGPAVEASAEYLSCLEGEGQLAATDVLAEPRLACFDARFQATGVVSALQLPLLLAGRCQGVLSIASCRRRDWSPEESLFAAGAAHLVSLVLERNERTQLEARERRLGEALQLLVSTALGLLESRDSESLLRQVVAGAGRLLGTEHSYLTVRSAGSEEPAQAVGTGAFLPSEKLVPVKGGATDRVLTTGETVVLRDYAAWPNAVPQFRYFRATVVVPLTSAGDVVGALALAHVDPDRQFDAVDVRLLEDLARFATLILHERRLVATAQSELAERQRVSAELAALNRELEHRVAARTEELNRIVTALGELTTRLDAERARSQALLAAIPDLMFEIDAEDRFVDFRAEVSAQLYAAPGAFLGKRADEVLPVHVAHPLMAALTRVRSGQQVGEELDYHLMIAEETHYYEARLRAVLEGHVLVLVRDVTARRLMEQELRRSEERYRSLFESSLDLIQSVDVEGRLRFVNRAWLEATGYQLEEVPALDLARLVAPDSLSRFESVLFTVASGEPVRAVETAFLAKDGRRVPLEGAVVPRLEDGRVVASYGFFRDVSERHRHELEQAALRSRLNRSERLAAMGELVAGVAHEVRNPLFAIGASLDALEAEHGNAGLLGEYLERLRRDIDRLSGLMQDLLDLGRPTSPLAHRRLPIQEPIRLAVRAVGPLAAKVGVAVVAEEGPPAEVNGDCGRLSQLLQNLLENALQHAPTASRVSLRQTPFRERAPMWCEIVVLDEGPGFAPADLPRVFEPFFSRRKGGTGLGLAIAQRIAEEHGGELEATNRDASGACLRVRIPLAQWTDAPGTAAPLPAATETS